MKKPFYNKKGAALAVLLLIFTFVMPLTSSINNATENVTINFHMFGIPSKSSKEINVPRFQAEEVYDKIKELQTEIANNPESEKVRQLQEEIADFTLKYNLLSGDLSQKLVSSKSDSKDGKIFNLLSPSKSSSSSASQFLCNFVSTGSGSSLPIIVLPRVIPVLLSPIPRALMIWNTKQGVTSCGGLYSNTGFIAYGEQNGIAIGFWGVGFTFNLPPFQGYGVLGYALYANVNAEQIQHFPPNNPPVISNPSPTNHEQNIPLSLSKLSFHLTDADNDLMSYTVTTEPNIGSGIGNLKRDGDYSISLSNLELSKEYTWTVNVDDGKDTTTSTFSFVTVKEEPVISNPYPGDYSSAQTNLTELRFDIFDAQGDLMDYSVETSPDIGSKSGYDVSDGTVIVPVSGLSDNTWYHWYVNVTDGLHWTREVFSFFTGGLGLVGYWSFDEGSGNIAYDSSIYGNHGTIHGASWTTGISGSALEFDGNDGVWINDDPSLDGFSSLTISVWAKPYNHKGGNLGFVIGKYQAHQSINCPYRIWAYEGDWIAASGDGSNCPKVRTPIINDEQWHHLVLWWDGAELKLYVNGIEKDSTSANTFLYNNNEYLRFGERVKDGYFNGIIDEVRIYSRELSENEILDLYTNN